MAETVAHRLRHVIGHPMAKAAVEMAVLDAQLRAAGQSFAGYLGGVRDTVPSGVSVGIQDSIEQTLRVVEGYLDDGYVRIKLKIKPGWDVELVRAVRGVFGDDVPLQVDANAAYTLLDATTLRKLDEFGLLLLEQPLAEDDLRQHAVLATRLQTPICLDESVVSARSAADAIALGAAQVINIKPGRVGGYLEAVRIHDLARAHGIAVWCGGMLETGLGRSANAALASLPGFVLPGDISASARFYDVDLTEPVEMVDGQVAVDTSPGIGSGTRPRAAGALPHRPESRSSDLSPEQSRPASPRTRRGCHPADMSDDARSRTASRRVLSLVVAGVAMAALAVIGFFYSRVRTGGPALGGGRADDHLGGPGGGRDPLVPLPSLPGACPAGRRGAGLVRSAHAG